MNTYKNYLGAFIAAIGLFVVWVWAVPTYNNISDYREAIKERERLLTSRAGTLARIDELNRQYQEKINDVNRISSIVPGKKSIPEIVTTIEDVSLRNGLRIIDLSVSEKNENTDELFSTLIVNVNFDGSYISLTNLLSDLEKSLRIFDITSLDTTGGSNPNNDAILNFKIQAMVYFLE